MLLHLINISQSSTSTRNISSTWHQHCQRTSSSHDIPAARVRRCTHPQDTAVSANADPWPSSCSSYQLSSLRNIFSLASPCAVRPGDSYARVGVIFGIGLSYLSASLGSARTHTRTQNGLLFPTYFQKDVRKYGFREKKIIGGFSRRPETELAPRESSEPRATRGVRPLGQAT